MSKGLIIYDYNGTIIDDTAAWLGAAQAHFKLFLDSTPTIEALRSAYDTPITKTASNLGVHYSEHEKTLQKEADSVFHKIYSQGLQSVKLREGTSETLTALNNAQYKQVLFSNHQDNKLKAEAEQFGIAQHFNCISGRETHMEIIHKTTKSERIQNFIQMSRYAKSHICIIGDSPEEANIAKELDIQSIGIMGGYSSDARMEQAGHTALIQSMSQVPATLKRILG